MQVRILMALLVLAVLVAASADAQRFTLITNNTGTDQYPRVNEDGTVFTWVGGSEAWVWDGGPSPRQLTTGASVPIPYDLTISGDGQTVGYISNRGVWVIPTAGGTPKQAWAGKSASDSAQGPLTLSHDGSLICFSAYDSASRSSDLWVARTDGSSSLNVSQRNGTSFHDREGWMSADGKWVVYTALVGSSRDIWIASTDGQTRKPLTSFGTAKNIRFPVIDRFATTVAYGSNDSGAYLVYTLDVGGGAITTVSKAGTDNWMPYLSELDGGQVSFKTNELGTSEEVYIAWADGSHRRQVTTFQGGLCRLTNSSHALNGDGTMGVYVTSQNFQGQNPTGDREIILWHDALTRSGVVTPGKTVQLNLDVPGRPGDVYALRCAFSRSPGIPIPGAGTVPLTPDDLFFLSGAVPTIFQNFSGVLDPNGLATAAILVPNVPALYGIRIYAAFVSVGGSGIFLSNSLSLTIL
jgi:hypothetical protein